MKAKSSLGFYGMGEAEQTMGVITRAIVQKRWISQLGRLIGKVPPNGMH